MYIVFYSEYFAGYGECLKHYKFDTLKDAEQFAKKVNGTIEKRIALI